MSEIKFKSLTKEQKEQFVWGVDSQGMDYWCQNYCDEGYDGTEVGFLANQACELLNKLDTLLEGYQDEFDAEDE